MRSPLPRGTALVAVVTASLMSFTACSASDASGNGDDAGPTFTPIQGDFQSFHSWQSFTFIGQAIPDSPHLTAGLRTDYLNHLPPPGATSFPVGTIIVKEVDQGTATSRSVFAMVKVGGGYNTQGAVDWEWYELTNNADGSESIRWNGVAPPPGDPYANSPVTCNQCHGQAKGNDFVQSPDLQLAALAQSDGGSVGSPNEDAGATE
jgi:hypothetical protein